MSSVYIATGYNNREGYVRARDLARRFGLAVSFNWTLYDPPPEFSRRERDGFFRWAAEAELAGVRAADLVLGLLPGGLGTHAEIGMALALGKPLVLYAAKPEHFMLSSGNGDPACLFHLLAKEMTSDWADVEAFVAGWCKEAG